MLEQLPQSELEASPAGGEEQTADLELDKQVSSQPKPYPQPMRKIANESKL